MTIARIKEYYRLAKPGIVYGNIFTTIAAFFFATHGNYSVLLVVPGLCTFVGLSLVIASASVFNNYFDRGIDAKMERTRTRALVTGSISVRNACMYGTVLGLAGLALLVLYVNILSACIALFGFISYVFIYTFAKRKTAWGALIGTVPGAVPIVVGYTAVTNHLDLAALILFLVLIFWQMPHFYAIALRRMKEYEKAEIPVFPLLHGARATKVHILLYIIAYLLATLSLWLYGFAGYIYVASVLVFGVIWLWKGTQGFASKTAETDAVWAKKLFLFSLIVLVTFSLAIAITPLFP